MNSFKFNTVTKEIEIKGSESFIESNFYMIENLLAKSLRSIKTKGSKKMTAHKEPVLLVEAVEPQKTEAVKISEVIDTPETKPATQKVTLEVRGEPKVNRPPVRKYFNTFGKLIRSEDTSINRNPVVNVNENMPIGISITSLKEKFGLSDDKIEEVVREAEKHGKVRRDMNGSYVWV